MITLDLNVGVPRPFTGSGIPSGPNGVNTYSASLDGTDDYLYFGSTAPGTALALGTTDLAISLWFNPANITTQDFLFRGGNARVFTNTSGGLQVKGLDYVSSNILISGALTANTWHHLVIERTSSTQKVYIDNVLKNTQTTSGSFTIEHFGYFTSTGYFWEGGIDEISIHSAGLSASDVSAIYNSGSPTDLTGLYNITGWWRMGDDSTGTTVNDLVGSNDLTAANGVNLTSTDVP